MAESRRFLFNLEGEKMTLYKVLNEDGRVYHRYYDFKWNLPHNGQPGEWMPPITGELIPCQNGYHLCRDTDLIHWFGPALFVAEYRGDRQDADTKVVIREARLLQKVEAWNPRTLRIFACDCAERVLPFFEKKYPEDKRPRLTIETARRFADGKATMTELNAAWDAAWDAARAAAWTAAWAAARAAARAAEQSWQTKHLLELLELAF